MRIFINHISRSGGTSLIKYLGDSFDGTLIVVNSRTTTSERSLLEKFRVFKETENAIIIGHTHQPSLPNTRLVTQFWRSVYNESDRKLTIVRNPADRSISWLKAAGHLGKDRYSEDGNQYLFRLPSSRSLKAVESIEKTRGSRSLLNDSIYECILTDNFYSDFPDNRAIAMSIANYPIELLSARPAMQWLTPLPLRGDAEIAGFKGLYSDFSWDRLRDYLAIPEYEFYALERSDALVNALEECKLTRKGVPFPQINSISADEQISTETKRVITNLYPESYLVWKHALGIL